MPENGPSDAELLADWLRNRHEAAFHALVARYAGLVHQAGLRTTGDDSLAAEASQLTFITLARKARSLASRSSLAGWLHLTAVMQAKNLLRQRLREHRKRELLRTHMETDSHGPTADAWRRMQPVLDEALAALSSKDREALLLRFYRSLSVREIAAALGIATDAAQKRLDRATERLRHQLARRGCQVGSSLGAIMIAGFGADSQAAIPSSSVLASKAIAAATGSTASTLTTIGIIIMTKKATIAAGVAVLLAGAAAVTFISRQDDPAKAGTDSAAAQKPSAPAPPAGHSAADPAAERAARSKPRDPAENPEFIAKYGDARTNLSKHVANNLISLLEDAVAMGEMVTSGEAGNAFGGPRNGLRMSLGGDLVDNLKLSDEQQEKAGAIYREYQKREIVKSKETIEKLKKDPTAIMQLMLASDAHSRGAMTQEEYDELQKSNAENLKGTINPLDRENFRGGQPMKDETFRSELSAILEPEQAETFGNAATEQAAKAEDDRTMNALPSMELEKMDQTVTSAKKLTAGMKSMMEGMGGLQDLGPIMEQQRKAREAQRAAETQQPQGE
ncbi:RNA polymerase sigma factor [Luteolibacter luteus]|uniref:RNA polymerase sigma factor n=1 Tax=Luteolibacter luteus TaxID=2728835 RepID=A0A858RFW6_9BACT|nr:RNA polymerase sigma factor [Luteolibacter luteus]QJE95652.1 RNA polymerase sigma factor [Luteolibacter luteus]